MDETSKIVILGGGVVGCSIAYYLSREGVKSTIVEREGIGSQASGYSVGGLNPLEGSHIPGQLAPLAIESYRMHADLWEWLKEETGICFQGRVTKMVTLAFSEAEIPGLLKSLEYFENAGSDGFSGCWMDAKELLNLEPRLSSKLIGGALLRGNRSLDSFEFTRALADAAEKRGATFRHGLVETFETDGNRVNRVILGDGEIDCEQVVLAAGPWSGQLVRCLNLDLPVEPLKGELLRMKLPGLRLPCDFMGDGFSIYAKPDGLVWCGTTEEWQGFDRKPSDSARVSILKGAMRILPDIAKAELIKHTACLRPMTTDAMPVIGRAPGWDNVFLATGAGRKGILLSTGMGKSITDLLIARATEISIEHCSPERYG